MPRKTKQEIIDEQQSKIEELESKLQDLEKQIANLEKEKENLQTELKANERKYNERGAGRKKNPKLEDEYYQTAKEIIRLQKLGIRNKQMLEEGMITKINPKTKKIEPISQATFYRCLQVYEERNKK